MNVSGVGAAVLSSLDAGRMPDNGSTRAVTSAVSAINDSGLWPGRALRVHLDVASQQMTVQVLNSVTHEVLGQMPSELALEMADELRSAANEA